jgi:hypothetical protein
MYMKSYNRLITISDQHETILQAPLENQHVRWGKDYQADRDASKLRSRSSKSKPFINANKRVHSKYTQAEQAFQVR